MSEAINTDTDIILEKLNSKSDLDLHNIDGGGEARIKGLTEPRIITTYVNGNNGYRIWSDGYCEQWGETSTQNTTTKISFLKKFSAVPRILGSVVNQIDITVGFVNVAVDGFYAATSQPGTTWAHGKLFTWRAFGYLAQGQY